MGLLYYPSVYNEKHETTKQLSYMGYVVGKSLGGWKALAGCMLVAGDDDDGYAHVETHQENLAIKWPGLQLGIMPSISKNLNKNWKCNLVSKISI